MHTSITKLDRWEQKAEMDTALALVPLLQDKAREIGARVRSSAA